MSAPAFPMVRLTRRVATTHGMRQGRALDALGVWSAGYLEDRIAHITARPDETTRSDLERLRDVYVRAGLEAMASYTDLLLEAFDQLAQEAGS